MNKDRADREVHRVEDQLVAKRHAGLVDETGDVGHGSGGVVGDG